MQGIYDWIKNLVYFYILMTAVLHLLPKSNFQDNELPAEGFWGKVRNLCTEHDTVLIIDDVRAGFRLDLAGLEELQQTAYREEYEKAIAKDISLMAQEENLQTLSAEVKLSRDCRVTSVALSVIPDGGEEGVLIEKITFQDNSSAYPGVRELKQKIVEFYEVADSQVQIMVQEG